MSEELFTGRSGLIYRGHRKNYASFNERQGYKLQMAKQKWYAVAKGRKTGIYLTWNECEAQVKGYSGAKYKGFTNKREAEKWLKNEKESYICRANELLATKRQQDHFKYELLSQEQRYAFERMLQGNNIFLTGEAGTGKSFLLNYFLQYHPGKNIIICAPTGIAALKIHGATIHRVFGIDIKPKLPNQEIGVPREVIKDADIIIIDEISMCRFDLFDYVCRYIEKAQELSGKKKQLIVVGDFYQLPPVMSTADKEVLHKTWKGTIPPFEDGFAFHSPCWERMKFDAIILKEVIRQKGEADFIHHLNRIRIGDKSAISWFHQHASIEEQRGVTMYGRNEPANNKNKEEMKKFQTPVKLYHGSVSGLFKDYPTDKALSLCIGARVMALINDPAGNYRNGSLGTVCGLKDNSVEVRFDNGKAVGLKRYTWEAVDYHITRKEDGSGRKLVQCVIGTFSQLPLKLAFAVTIHKSQGQTYERVNLEPRCFDKGQLYVALSRVTSIQALHLIHPIEEDDLKVSKEAAQFYAKLVNKLV